MIGATRDTLPSRYYSLILTSLSESLHNLDNSAYNGKDGHHPDKGDYCTQIGKIQHQ
jgi:hypothetical protein